VLIAMGSMAARAGAFVYWSYENSARIERAWPDGSHVQSNFIGGASARGIVTDVEHVYWVDRVTRVVGRANLDGGEVDAQLIGTGGEPSGVAIAGGHIYWSSPASRSIGRANLDGSDPEQNFISGLYDPLGIAIASGHIYWVDLAVNTIGRANLDGSEVNDGFISGADDPLAIAADSGHVYWSNSGSQTIGRANLDGSEVDESFVATGREPAGVAVDSRHLYWTTFGEGSSGRIARANLDGSEVDPDFITVDNSLHDLWGLYVDSGTPAAPTLSARASGPITLGGAVSDTATLAGGRQATGSITFRLYGPEDPTCSAAPAYTSAAVPVSGDGDYGSPAFTPTAAGTYRWTATYSGDDENEAVPGSCDGAEAAVLVGKATPTLGTTPSAGTVGDPLRDEATVDGRVGPRAGATVEFRLYGPGDPTCAGAAVFTSTVAYPVAGGAVSSAAFMAPHAGTYRWTAVYSGDADNEGAGSSCAEASTVAPATPTLTTAASAPVSLGSHISATLAGGHSPTGTVTFRLYGPGDADCSAVPAWTSPVVSVSGDGTYPSPEFTPTAPGTYRWMVGYSGDGDNEAVAGVCNGADASVLVAKASSAISLVATPSPARRGAPVVLTAKVTGVDPTGTVTFADGSTVLGTASLGIDGTASITTTGLAVGVARLAATYGGDEDNLPSDSALFEETIFENPSGPEPGSPVVDPPAADPPVADPPVDSIPVKALPPRVRLSYDPNHPHIPDPVGGPRWTFHFADRVPGTTFYCRLDKAPWKPCRSPLVYRHLAPGRHAFALRSVDRAQGIKSAVRKVKFTVGGRVR